MTALTAREWDDFARAQLALLRAALTVRVRPRGRLVRAVSPDAVSPDESSPDRDPPAVPGRSGGDPPGADPHPEMTARALEIATGVRRAVRYAPFHPTCLVRAIALQRMLDRAGIEEAVVRVGVRRDGGAFSAHAWVTLRGQVLGEPGSAVETFQPLHDLEVGR